MVFYRSDLRPAHDSIPAQAEAGLPGANLSLAAEAGPTQTGFANPLLANPSGASPDGSQTLGTPDPVTEPRFVAFRQWWDGYQAAPADERPSLEEAGRQLASRRREEMVDMIQSNPRRALELAIPDRVRDQLPATIQSLLEEPFSARGDLDVLCELELEPGGHEHACLRRTLDLNDQIYQAFVFGRRLDDPSRRQVALQGILLEGLAAVDERPLRLLTDLDGPTEFESPDHETSDCAWCRQSADSGEAVRLVVAGELRTVCSQEHLAALEEDLANAGSMVPAASDPPSLQASAWTEGSKRLILIRVDFSDLAGDPFSESTATNLVRQLDEFYDQSSYGRTRFLGLGQGSDVTPVFRMPQTAAFYGQNDASRLRRDARAAAVAAGYTLTSYNLDVICFGSVPGFKFAGLAYVGQAGAWIRGTSSVGVLAHELGHNFGLNHANFWDTAGESVIGPGESIEYGDTFDTMGSAGAGAKHFNARYKHYLNWLDDNQVIAATQSGAYRIGPHDDRQATGALAIRVARNSQTNYWIEFRQQYTSNPWLMNGAGLRWARNGNQSSLLLDTSPGSVSGKDDAALLIGRTFSDPAAGIHITPISKGSTRPETLDVFIQLGTPPGNRPPALTLVADRTTTAVNTTVRLEAQADDPDGDPLAYGWDFGDRTFGDNRAEVSRAWTATGEYNVYCWVSDMKGGVALRSVVVRVGSPSTYRLAGRLVTESGPASQARVYVSSTQLAYTDSDGYFTLVGLPAGSYTVRASLAGTTITPLNFTNPVRVGPSADNLTLVGWRTADRPTDALVARGSIWQFKDDGTDQGTAWRALDFDDSAWNEGAAPLGYGDDNEKTTVGFGPNANSKYVTTYFRRRFPVADPTVYSLLSLGLRRDDGAIVYLNGKEVSRQNMPSGTVTYTTLASSAVSGADESTFNETSIDLSLLQPGTNLLAIEVHQSSRSSSDMVFDLELMAARLAGFTVPALAWRTEGSDLILSWPAGSLGWVLQIRPSLQPSIGWTTVDAGVAHATSRQEYILPLNREQMFFRLALP
jgi:hypothetical protein